MKNAVFLPPDKGPRAVVTELGVLRFGEDKRMYLAEYYPGVTPQQVQDHTGFALDITRAVEARPPEAQVLDTLLRRVDPARVMI